MPARVVQKALVALSPPDKGCGHQNFNVARWKGYQRKSGIAALAMNPPVICQFSGTRVRGIRPS